MKKNPSAKEKRYLTIALSLAGIVALLNVFLLCKSLMNKGIFNLKQEDIQEFVLYVAPVILIIFSIIIPLCRDRRKDGLVSQLRRECDSEGDTLKKIRRIKKCIEKYNFSSNKSCKLKEKLLAIKTEITMSMESKDEYFTNIIETCFLGLISMYVENDGVEKAIVAFSYVSIWCALLLIAENKKEENEKNILILSVVESMENSGDEKKRVR